jgi:hypothetical protein
MVKPFSLFVPIGVALVVVFSVYAIAPLLASVDARRVAQQRGPMFCWSHWFERDSLLSDGGPSDITVLDTPF